VAGLPPLQCQSVVLCVEMPRDLLTQTHQPLGLHLLALHTKLLLQAVLCLGRTDSYFPFHGSALNSMTSRTLRGLNPSRQSVLNDWLYQVHDRLLCPRGRDVRKHLHGQNFAQRIYDVSG
jgi:hypothetical protein